jgi:hypothetical protein
MAIAIYILRHTVGEELLRAEKKHAAPITIDRAYLPLADLQIAVHLF